MKKPLILGLLLLAVPLAAGISFSSNQVEAVVDSSSVDLEYTEPGLDGNLTVTYRNITGGETLINSSSSSPYRVTFETGVEEGDFNISAEASNSTSFSNTTRFLDLEVDTVKPGIPDSISHTRNDDGTVLVSWEANDTESGLTELRLYRTVDEEKLVNSTEVDAEEKTVELLDANEERFYDKDFSYRVEAEDDAGNVESRSYGETVSPKDRDPPEISSRFPEAGKRVNTNENGELTVTVRDQLSGLGSVNLSVLDTDLNRTNLSSETTEFSVDISGFDNEETYTVTVTAEDGYGNTADFSWDFTVDTSPPETEGEKWPDREYIEEKTRVGVDVSGTDVSNVAEMKCLLDGEKFGSDLKPNNNDIYSCGKLDPDNWGEGGKTLQARYTDNLGNSRTVDIGTYTFDTRPPVIEDLEIEPLYSSTAPNVTVEASDTVSEIQNAEYILSGNENTVNTVFNSKKELFSFQPLELEMEKGENLLEVRVQDASGKWSPAAEKEFFYYPGETPRPELSYQKLVVPPGGEKEFRIELRNKGKVSLVSTRLKLQGAVNGSTGVFRLRPDEQRTLFIPAKPVEGPGIYVSTLELDSSTLNTRYPVETVVKASEDEEKELRQRLKGLEKDVEMLEKNISRMEERGIGENRMRPLEDRVSLLEENVSRLKNYSEKGEFYRVADRIDGVENSSRSSFDTAEKVEKKYQRHRFIVIGGSIFAAISLLAGIYWFSRSNNQRIEKALEPVKKGFSTVNPARLVPSIRLPSPARFIPLEELKVKIGIRYYRLKNRWKEYRGEKHKWEGFH